MDEDNNTKFYEHILNRIHFEFLSSGGFVGTSTTITYDANH
jgi:hypothetical protein